MIAVDVCGAKISGVDDLWITHPLQKNGILWYNEKR
jgi:hypothetical protein